MEPHRGIHHRLHHKRQGLGGVVGGLVPNGSQPTPAQQTPTASKTTGGSGGLGGIIGGFTSLLGDTQPPSGRSSATPTTPLTLPSSSSTGSTTTSTHSVQTTTSSSTTSTPTPTPTPTPTSSAPAHTSDGTSVVYVTSTPTASAPPSHPTSFLQNPSLEVGVFTLIGVAVLIVVCVTITWVVRKRRRERLERDIATAVTFDPGVVDRYERQATSIEKRRVSVSSSSHGHGYGYGYGYGIQPTYAPPQEYQGSMGYGQFPMAAYRAPSPGAIPYRVPSPTVPQPIAQGGANLTRKFSDRKPVPPLLPNPAYDSSSAHVSIPPQFYQQ